MFRRYWTLIAKRLPTLFWHSLHTIEGWIALAFFVVLLVNRKVAVEYMNWEGLNPLWSLLPMAALALHGFMQTVHEKMLLIEKERDDLRAKLGMPPVEQEKIFIDHPLFQKVALFL